MQKSEWNFINVNETRNKLRALLALPKVMCAFSTPQKIASTGLSEVPCFLCDYDECMLFFNEFNHEIGTHSGSDFQGDRNVCGFFGDIIDLICIAKNIYPLEAIHYLIDLFRLNISVIEEGKKKDEID